MKTAPGPNAASSRPPIAGPAKMPMLSIALAETLAAVSSSGVRASEGTRAAWAGRNAVAATPTRAGDHVDDDGARIGVDRHGSATMSTRPYEIGDDHDETPVVAVSEQGRERRGERGREPAEQADDADRRGAALLVGVDDDGDAVGPGLRSIEPAQASSDPAEVRVRKDLPKRPTRPGQLPQESPHRAQDRSRVVYLKGRREDSSWTPV